LPNTLDRRAGAFLSFALHAKELSLLLHEQLHEKVFIFDNALEYNGSWLLTATVNR
jgi:hypothetical protein